MAETENTNVEVDVNNYFDILNNINVNEHTEEKNGLTYLSWAWAWAKVKHFFPDATYTIYERADGTIYWTDGKTCWVKTGVTINGVEHIEYLPIMDYRNKSIPVDSVTSFDANKSIQRSLTKACARHGLGLYIYAGEDLPEEDKNVLKDALGNKIDEIGTIVEGLIKSGKTDRNGVASIIKKHLKVNNKPCANYKVIPNVEIADKIISELKSVVTVAENKEETK